MFLTYKTFNDPELATQLIIHFDENNIEYEVEDDSKIFDPSFSYNQATRCISVKIKQLDFEKANLLLTHISAAEINSVSRDYYLFSMSDTELMEIVRKPDEWNQLDFVLAKNILKERNKEIDASEIEELMKERINELSRPDKILTVYILLAWFFVIAGSILWISTPRPMYTLIIITGIMTGTGLYYSKKTLPDGQSIFRYNLQDRKQGKFILVTGIVLLVVTSIIVFSSLNWF